MQKIRSYLQRIFLIHDFRPNMPGLEEVVDSLLPESDLEVSEVSIVVLDGMGESNSIVI